VVTAEADAHIGRGKLTGVRGASPPLVRTPGPAGPVAPIPESNKTVPLVEAVTKLHDAVRVPRNGPASPDPAASSALNQSSMRVSRDTLTRCSGMSPFDASVRVMRTVPTLRRDLDPNRPVPMAWVYEDGEWKQDIDHIAAREDGDVDQERADAGYCGQSGKDRQPALAVPYSGPDSAQEESGLRMWVRDKHPQCLITVEWSLGEIRSVYAARYPDGLDLMAKWAPIFRQGAQLHRPPGR
jgi:hypothetical protein